MATTTLRSGNSVATHKVNSTWSNVITSIPGAANVAGLLKAVSSSGIVNVVKGGATAPADDSFSGDTLLMPGDDGIFCQTDNIWVRCSPNSNAIIVFETI